MNSAKDLIYNEVLNIVEGIEINKEDFFSDKHLTNFGVTSIQFIELIINLEGILGQDFDPEEFTDIRTANDLLVLVSKKMEGRV